MKAIPAPEFYRSPARVLKRNELIRFTPYVRLFECKTRTMLTRSASLGWFSLWGWAIKHPILAQPNYFSTRLVFERIQEVVITVFGIGSHNVQTMLT